MSTNTRFQYHSEAWEPENFEPVNADFLPEVVFLIEIYAHVANDLTFWNKFPVPRDHLLRDNTSWSTISNFLSQTNVPLDAHPCMITKIINCARSVATSDHNLNRKIIPLVASLRVESFNGQLFSRLGHATRPLIDALEKVRVEGFSKQCVICLEEMLVESEAARTPCSHLYHEPCIRNWLEKNNACPLCRFQLS